MYTHFTGLHHEKWQYNKLIIIDDINLSEYWLLHIRLGFTHKIGFYPQ